MRVNIKKGDIEKIIKKFYDDNYCCNVSVRISFTEEMMRDPAFMSVFVVRNISKDDIKVEVIEELHKDKITDIFQDFIGEDYKINNYFVDENFATKGFGLGEQIEHEYGITLDVTDNYKKMMRRLDCYEK